LVCKTNDKNTDTLKVNIDVENGGISVYNRGCGIPVEIHSSEKIYIPELVFYLFARPTIKTRTL